MRFDLGLFEDEATLASILWGRDHEARPAQRPKEKIKKSRKATTPWSLSFYFTSLSLSVAVWKMTGLSSVSQ